MSMLIKTFLVSLQTALLASSLAWATLPTPQLRIDVVQLRDFYAENSIHVLHDGDRSEISTIRACVGVKNVGPITLNNVEWRIDAKGTASFSSGLQIFSVITSSQTAQACTPFWNLPDGTYTFTAMVDHDRKLGETEQFLANNRGKMTITVQQMASHDVDPKEVGPFESAFQIYSLDDKANCEAKFLSGAGIGMGLSLNYKGPYPRPASFQGCTAYATFYRGVTVKNGWAVSEVKVTHSNYNAGYDNDWSWVQQPPAIGSTSLFTQVRLRMSEHDDTGHFIALKIRLWGPASQSPFASSPLRKPPL
jgi:hypothetical protein